MHVSICLTTATVSFRSENASHQSELCLLRTTGLGARQLGFKAFSDDPNVEYRAEIIMVKVAATLIEIVEIIVVAVAVEVEEK